MFNNFIRSLERKGFSQSFIWLAKTIINAIPPIVITMIFVWSYRTFLMKYIIGLFQYGELKEGLFFFFFYHFTGILTMWSYWATVLVRPRTLPTTTVRIQPKDPRLIRYGLSTGFCNRCENVKPDRAHHCFWCSSCIVKMDHHCPWVGNCVGEHNYKLFVLMLTYTVIFCSFISISLASYDWHQKKFHSLIAVTFALTLGCLILLVFHIYLLFTNQTTIECGIKLADVLCCQPAPNPYNLGYFGNFKAVFGPDPMYWWLPIINHRTGFDEFVDIIKAEEEKQFRSGEIEAPKQQTSNQETTTTQNSQNGHTQTQLISNSEQTTLLNNQSISNLDLEQEQIVRRARINNV